MIFKEKTIVAILCISLCAFLPNVTFAWNNSPYAPGATLNPDCLPTDTNCDVATFTPSFFSALSPMFYSSTTGVFSISQASSTSNGYLSLVDWTTFNNKQNAIATGTSAQYLKGDLSLGTFPTALSSFNNDLNYLLSSVASSTYLTISNASSTYYPLNSNPAGYLTSFTETEPAFTASPAHNLASATSDGYISSSDWNIFNNKGATSTVRSFFSSISPALVYDASSGQFGVNSANNIPLTASTSNWDATYNTVNSNAVNWNTAYNTISSNFTGTSSGINTGDETQSSIKTKLGAASTGTDGYLSSTDWNTFNAKQNAITTGTASQYLKGDLSLGTFPTALSGFTNDTNFIGTTSANTLADARIAAATSTVRNFFSSLIPSLSYDSSAGTLSLASGYEIPLTASTTNWDATYNTVNSNANNWNSAYNTITASSSNWNSIYNTVTSNLTNWNTAYSWGNHATAGYLLSSLASSTYLTISNAASTYYPLNSNPTGYLTSFTETDPIFISSPAHSITSGDITNLSHLSGINTGDETQSSIKTKLGAASSGVDGYLTGANWTTFNNKQNAITTGTASQYLKGDLSLGTFPTALSGFTNDTNYITSSGAPVQSIFGRTGIITAQSGDYNTSQVTENSNLYFTNARAIGSTLTGYTSGAGTISSSDSVLSAIQKLNGNVGNLITGVSSVSNSDGTLTISPTSGAVVASLALSHANTWTGQQTFNTSAPIFGTMTQGSVLFAGAGGVLSQSNSNLFWDNTNGRLGIGTTTPAANLAIQDSSGLSGTNPLFSIASSSALGTGTTTLFSVLGNGNGYLSGKLGVGVTPSVYGLQVAGTGYFSSTVFAPTFAAQSFSSAAYNNGDMTIITKSGYGINFEEGASSTMYIKTGGNVGIGTTSPSAKLQVVTTDGTGLGYLLTGLAQDTTTDSSNGVAINLIHNGANNRQFAIGDSAMKRGLRVLAAPGSVGTGYVTLDGYDWSSSGVVYPLNINGSLSVGFGTYASPSATLYVKDATASTGATSVLIQGGAAAADATTNQLFRINQGGGTKGLMVVQGNGNVGIGTTSPSYPLDVQVGAVTTSAINTNGVIRAYILGASGSFGINNGGIFSSNGGNSLKLVDWGTGATLQNLSVGGLYSSGNIGIGTTTPAAKLSIHDNSGLAGTNPLFVIASSTSGYLATTTLLTVLGNGNVGIGTANPTSALHVVGDIYSPGATTLTVGYVRPTYWVGSGAYYGATPSSSFTLGQVNTTPVISLYAATTTFSGFVGIGKNNPSVPLDVAGALNASGQITTTAAVQGANLYIQNVGSINTQNSNGRVNLYTSYGTAQTGDQGIIGALTPSNISAGTVAPTVVSSSFANQTGSAGWTLLKLNALDGAGTGAKYLFDAQLGGVSMFNVTGSGNIGIGVASPSAQLHTTGTVRFANFGAGTLQTDSAGNVTAGASDERLKNIQGNFIRGLADLQGISPILYKWKPETGFDATNTYAGFSAQNVQLSIPEAVSADPKGYLSIQDRPIIAALVNAVKEIGSMIVKVENGVSYLANIVVTHLTVGSADKPTGITIYDSGNGQPYCMRMYYGQTQTLAGTCESLPVNVSTNNSSTPVSTSTSNNVSNNTSNNSATNNSTTTNQDNTASVIQSIAGSQNTATTLVGTTTTGVGSTTDTQLATSTVISTSSSSLITITASSTEPTQETAPVVTPTIPSIITPPAIDSTTPTATTVSTDSSLSTTTP